MWVIILNTYQLLFFPGISCYPMTPSYLFSSSTIWHPLPPGKDVKAKAEKRYSWAECLRLWISLVKTWQGESCFRWDSRRKRCVNQSARLLWLILNLSLWWFLSVRAIGTSRLFKWSSRWDWRETWSPGRKKDDDSLASSSTFWRAPFTILQSQLCPGVGPLEAPSSKKQIHFYAMYRCRVVGTFSANVLASLCFPSMPRDYELRKLQL